MKKKKNKNNEERVLALDPTHRGFAYVVFEGTERLVDWANVYVEGRRLTPVLGRIDTLLRLYEPDVLVLEDYGSPASRRRSRACKLLRRAHKLALKEKIRAVLLSPKAVRGAFAHEGASTKEEIARVIAGRYRRELGSKLPPRRKIWMSEDLRINLFDAAALALAYYEAMGKKRRVRKKTA